MPWLTENDRVALEWVLEPRPATQGASANILPLSLYSSELKALKQIAGALEKVKNGSFASQIERTKKRYFRSLRIHGLVTGSADVPTLTPESDVVFQVAANDDGTSDYWRRNRDLVEGPLVRAIAEKLASGRGDEIQEQAKRVFFNVQFLLDIVPEAELVSSLQDLDLLRHIQFMNVVGFEPARFFRLSRAEKVTFRDAFAKVLEVDSSTAAAPTAEIEQRARIYREARAGIQDDIRFRVAGFITAYLNARADMGTRFPRLTRDLKATNMSSNSTQKVATPASSSREPLGPRQLIITGCPGSGKSFWLERQLTIRNVTVIRTQFHADTSYFDFVGSYKPVPVYESVAAGVTITAADGSTFSRGRPLINYQFVPGPFLEAYVASLQSPEKDVVLVVEELNRGNCAAIFGDMFQLLDRTADGCSRYSVNASHDLRVFLSDAGVLTDGKRLHLPGNLYLWATMNSADQGVFPLDTAFRRRWDFIYRGHGEPCEYPEAQRRFAYGGRTYDWDIFRSHLNSTLRALNVHEDKLIGPYFLTPEQLASPEMVLNKLLLYLWDDVRRFHQSDLFVDHSFADVAKTWADGQGAPLRVVLDSVPSLEDIPAEQEPQFAESGDDTVSLAIDPDNSSQEVLDAAEFGP